MLAPVDIAVLILVAVTAVIGFWTGFVWQVIRIVSLIASIWVALVYGPVVASFLGTRVPPSVRGLVSVVAVFLAAMVVLFLVGYLFRDVVNALKPQLTDRILGAGFGALLGALVAAFFAFAILEYAEEGSPMAVKVEESTVTCLIGRFLRHALPDGVRDVVDAEKKGTGAPVRRESPPPEGDEAPVTAEENA
jgi:uncharacterized membrane protein required for colicin V production